MAGYEYQKQYAKDNPEKVKEWRDKYHKSESYKKFLTKEAKRKKERYNNDPEYKLHIKMKDKQRRDNLKFTVLTYYSNEYAQAPSCVDCAMMDIRCLSIDHIYGGGTKHRKIVGAGHKFYQWLKKNKYPDGYDTVCMNCNFIRRYAYPSTSSPLIL
jgi:hypothetical protein